MSLTKTMQDISKADMEERYLVLDWEAEMRVCALEELKAVSNRDENKQSIMDSLQSETSKNPEKYKMLCETYNYMMSLPDEKQIAFEKEYQGVLKTKFMRSATPLAALRRAAARTF